MVGPSAATMRERSAPSVSMAATTAAITPVRAPRQPACAAPITPASASANSRGPQSAVDTPIASRGVRVTMASARGRFSRVHGWSATTTSGE